MPENTTVPTDPALTVNTPPPPVAPVIPPVTPVSAVSPEPAPLKKSNTLLWMVVLAVVTMLALGGAYLYTQGYFGTTTETTSVPADDSGDTAAVDAELASSETELNTLESDLVQFETEGGSF